MEEAIEGVTEEATVEAPEAEEVKEEAKPDGYDRVDFNTASPDQIEARFNRLYGQTKSFQKLAAEQARVIEDLQRSQNQVIDHLTEKESKDIETQLRHQIKEAHENGDTNAFLAANEQLLELKAQKFAKPTKPQPTSSNEDTYFEGREVVEAWQSETNERGQPLRPWASEGHPDFEAAQALSVAYFSKPAYSHLTTEQKLEAIDKRFGVSKPAAGQSVMSSRLTSQPKTSKVTLSPKAREIAVKMRIAGPGKSDDEHIAEYAKLFQNNKGVRK